MASLLKTVSLQERYARPAVIYRKEINKRVGLLDVISFQAPDRSGESVILDAGYVNDHLDELAGNEDLSRYIL